MVHGQTCSARRSGFDARQRCKSFGPPPVLADKTASRRTMSKRMREPDGTANWANPKAKGCFQVKIDKMASALAAQAEIPIRRAALEPLLRNARELLSHDELHRFPFWKIPQVAPELWASLVPKPVSGAFSEKFSLMERWASSDAVRATYRVDSHVVHVALTANRRASMASVDAVEQQCGALKEDTDARLAALEKKYDAQLEELTSRVGSLQALSAGMRFMLNLPSDEFVVEAHKAYGPQEPSESWCMICLPSRAELVPGPTLARCLDSRSAGSPCQQRGHWRCARLQRLGGVPGGLHDHLEEHGRVGRTLPWW